MRHEWGIRPVYKMVDTCAAEFDAATPYFYSTYETENEALPLDGPRAAAVVIGSGPSASDRGSSSTTARVHAAWALNDAGWKSVMINSNPETVSTDFDTSDRLYFEPLDEESVFEVLAKTSSRTSAPSDGQGRRGRAASPPPASIVQFGGQTAINLAEPCERAGAPVIGSSVRRPSTPPRTGACSSASWTAWASRSPPGPASPPIRGRPDRRPAHRLPRAGAPLLRPRRAGDGDHHGAADLERYLHTVTPPQSSSPS